MKIQRICDIAGTLYFLSAHWCYYLSFCKIKDNKTQEENTMEKSLFEQMGGTYTQVGDYLIPNLRLPEQQDQPIGVWGQRHARYLKQHHKIIYMNLLTIGKLNDYLVDIENQAEKYVSSNRKATSRKRKYNRRT